MGYQETRSARAEMGKLARVRSMKEIHWCRKWPGRGWSWGLRLLPKRDQKRLISKWETKMVRQYMESILLGSWLANGQQRNEIVAGRGLQSREGSCLGFKARRQESLIVWWLGGHGKRERSIMQKETMEGLKEKSIRMQEGWNKKRQGWGDSRFVDRWNDEGLSSHLIVHPGLWSHENQAVRS